MNQTPLSCEWCGKFVVAVRGDPSDERKLFEIFTDESGRLIKDGNDGFYLSGEHRCRVICGRCGRAVIMAGGQFYDRPSYDESKSLNPSQREVIIYGAKIVHSCKRN